MPKREKVVPAAATERSTFRGTVTRLSRLMNSVNGNPRWKVVLDGHGPDAGRRLATMTTADAMIGFVINDQSYAKRPHTYELDGRHHLAKVVSL